MCVSLCLSLHLFLGSKCFINASLFFCVACLPRHVVPCVKLVLGSLADGNLAAASRLQYTVRTFSSTLAQVNGLSDNNLFAWHAASLSHRRLCNSVDPQSMSCLGVAAVNTAVRRASLKLREVYLHICSPLSLLESACIVIAALRHCNCLPLGDQAW